MQLLWDWVVPCEAPASLHLAVTLVSFLPFSQGAIALAVTLQDHALRTINEKMFETPYLLGSFKQDNV